MKNVCCKECGLSASRLLTFRGHDNFVFILFCIQLGVYFYFCTQQKISGGTGDWTENDNSADDQDTLRKDQISSSLI